MPHFVYYVAASLDGYIADENGGVDWLPEPLEGEDYGYARFLAGVDGLLMGRRTYEQVRGFGEWPYAGQRVRVWTRRPLDDPPPEVEAIAGPAAEVAARLDAGGFRRIWLVGGAELAEALRREGLVDEWVVTLIPRTLGAGIPLFGGPDDDLEIVRADPFPGSILQLHLRRRPPQEAGGDDAAPGGS